ncbi:MAG: ferritin [Betaproteobacteria bacterium]|nr:ferritin [Betaproteobacteria bacterium]
MLSKAMNKNLNEQVTWEFYSGYLYLGMSAYFQEAGLPGFAHWMRIQAQEELSHGILFYNFTLGRGGSIKLANIDAPAAGYKNTLDVFEKTLAHENAVTARINKLVGQARKEEDFATDIFLQWFVSEQIEEEENVTGVLNKLKLIKNDGQGLLMLDKELGARTFTPPPALMGSGA